jgi:hypothetical protein
MAVKIAIIIGVLLILLIFAAPIMSGHHVAYRADQVIQLFRR